MSTVASTTVISKSESKSHAIIAYALMGIGLFTAAPMFVGAVWAMFKRRDALGTVYHSHYTNAIRTFWWALLWSAIGWLLIFVGIGWLILGMVWLWSLYRLINGFGKILADEAYPI